MSGPTPDMDDIARTCSARDLSDAVDVADSPAFYGDRGVRWHLRQYVLPNAAVTLVLAGVWQGQVVGQARDLPSTTGRPEWDSAVFDMMGFIRATLDGRVRRRT